MTNSPTHGVWRIRINGMEHDEPFVHAEFRDGHRVSVSIVSCRVLAGGVAPARHLLPAPEDIKINEAQYLAEYRRLNP